jgi:hypothetical protein
MESIQPIPKYYLASKYVVYYQGGERRDKAQRVVERIKTSVI